MDKKNIDTLVFQTDFFFLQVNVPSLTTHIMFVEPIDKIVLLYILFRFIKHIFTVCTVEYHVDFVSIYPNPNFKAVQPSYGTSSPPSIN